MDSLSHLVLARPPPLDPAWLRHEDEANLKAPKKTYASPLDRQPVYAEECRRLNARMLAPDGPYHQLSSISTQELAATSKLDNSPIPVLRFSDPGQEEQVAVVYFHGGGLYVGEADSEELCCRRIVADVPGAVVYSIGYRLMPAWPASTCLADALDVYEFVQARCVGKKIILVGSSSGGQLAAAVLLARKADGVVLRCPVTSDGGSSLEFVPERLRGAYTSATEPFETSLLGVFRRAVPRDGLKRLPLEATAQEMKALPRTWVQVCTNDTLYSDGVCYAMALREVGVEVEVEVLEGWPHTFWLKAPGLERAEEAERGFVRGVKWVLGE
ncbi:AB hydrolase superfamily protein 5 [Colletotrichum plurivorum]|uniref:AB hydrolase superfamily protein 5 n=1 Tax=Colletotrichum plurivorum TaxID=2175906 RepID=A0A8H6JZC0_9PEZI|nr:AB hydrolase superfamily protein 5 [Colletotrichum plurivorum]